MLNNINKIDNNAEQGAQTAARDPFNFPVPVHSLTDEQDKWPWDKPPRMTNPDKVVDFVVDKVEGNGETKEHFLRLMSSGVTVEEIVNTISLGGFTAGEFTPDVGEVIKPALAVYFVGLAVENKVPVVMFAKSETKEDGKMISRQDTMHVMKERNPEEFERVVQGLQAIREKDNNQVEQEEQPQGFINMRGDV